MPSVKVRENEPFDIAMRRFKRACEKAGVLAEVHRREYYEKPTPGSQTQSGRSGKTLAKKSFAANGTQATPVLSLAARVLTSTV